MGGLQTAVLATHRVDMPKSTQPLAAGDIESGCMQSQRNALSESVPKVVDKVEGQSSESRAPVKPIDHQSLDPSHPTGRMRYSEKKPPMHAPGDASEKPSDPKRGDAPVYLSRNKIMTRSTVPLNHRIQPTSRCQMQLIQVTTQAQHQWICRDSLHGSVLRQKNWFVRVRIEVDLSVPSLCLIRTQDL